MQCKMRRGSKKPLRLSLVVSYDDVIFSCLAVGACSQCLLKDEFQLVMDTLLLLSDSETVTFTISSLCYQLASHSLLTILHWLIDTSIADLIMTPRELCMKIEDQLRGYDLLEWYGDGTRVLFGCVVPSPTLQVKLMAGCGCGSNRFEEKESVK